MGLTQTLAVGLGAGLGGFVGLFVGLRDLDEAPRGIQVLLCEGLLACIIVDDAWRSLFRV